MKANVLIKKLLGAPAVIKSRTGFLIALVAFNTILGEAALTGIDFLGRNHAIVCMRLGLLGFLGWLTGRLCEARWVESTPIQEARWVICTPIQDAPAGEVLAEHPLAFLRSLRSWGVILVLLAGIISCLAAWRHHKPSLVARARPLPVTTITGTDVVTINNEARKASFPSLEFQGAVVNGVKLAALINGQEICLGEGISNAVLVAVDREHVLMAMEGQTNSLALRKGNWRLGVLRVRASPIVTIQHAVMKATFLINKLLGAPVVTKSRTGFLIALLAFLTMVGEAALTGIDFLSRNDAIVCMGLGLLGFLGWLTGRVREARPTAATPIQDSPAGEAVAEHPLSFLRSLKSWGVILVFLAGTLSCLAAWRRHEPPVVRARPRPVSTITVTNVVTKVMTNVVTITNEAHRVFFPILKLQGVVVNGGKSSALINGRVLCLGEGISNAVLVAVDSERAFMAMGGQTNVLRLRK